MPSRISGVKVLTAHPGLLFSPLQVTGGATVSERQGTSVQCGHTWIPVSFLLFSFGLLAASTFFFFFWRGSPSSSPSLPFYFFICLFFFSFFLLVKLSYKDFSFLPNPLFLLTFSIHFTTNKPLNDPSPGPPTAGVVGPPRPTALPLSARVPGPARERERSRGHGGDCGPAALGEPPPPRGPQRAAPGHAPPGPRPLVHGGSVPPDGRGGRTF